MSTAAPPPATSQSSSNTPSSPLSNTSTLLFGFLVSALSIFAVFMTVAIVWNRLVVRRRAIDDMLAMSTSPLHPQRHHRPTLWDVWAVPDKGAPSWADVKPVAVEKCNSPASSPETAQRSRAMSFWRDCLVNNLPPEITYLFYQPILQPSAASSHTDIPPAELSHGSEVQISLLIYMPHASRFHELAFATTNAVYHDPGLS